MRRFVQLLFISTVLASLAFTAHAGSFSKNRVAGDAQWVAHLNVQAMAQSKLFQAARDHAGKMHGHDLEQMKEQFGLDPFKDLLDATMYGSGDPEDGNMVIVATTTAAVDEAVVKLKEEMSVKEITESGRTFHVIGEDDEQTFFLIEPGKNSAQRTVVVAHDQEHLFKGVDVLEGKAKTLAAEVASPLAKAATPRPGSMFFAAAKGLPWMNTGDEDDPASKILSKADRMVMDMGEEGPNTYVEMVVATKDVEDARNISDILTGFMALGRMAADHQPDLAEVKSLLNSVKLSNQSNDVRILFQHPTEELIRIGNKMAEVAARHHGKHEDHHDHGEKHDDDRKHHSHTPRQGDAGHHSPHNRPH